MFTRNETDVLIIRKIEDPDKILKYGYVDFGGLGEYDPEIYEEVLLAELPQGYQMIKEKPIAMGKDLVLAIQKAFDNFDVATRLTVTGNMIAFQTLLNSETCNPLLKSDYDMIVLIAKASVSDEKIKALLLSTAKNWEEGVKFGI